MNRNKTLPTLSARQFSAEYNVPLATVTTAAKQLGIQKAGPGDNSPLLLTVEAQCKVIEFHAAALEREITKHTRRCIAASNEAIKQAEFLVTLSALSGSPQMVKAAEASLAEHRENKLAIGTSAPHVTAASDRLTNIIAGFKLYQL